VGSASLPAFLKESRPPNTRIVYQDVDPAPHLGCLIYPLFDSTRSGIYVKLEEV